MPRDSTMTWETVSEGLGRDGWMHRHVLSHAPLDAQVLLAAWAPEGVREAAQVRVWKDEAHMHHVAAKWPMRGLVRWSVRNTADEVWERLMVLWWIGTGGRISTAALAAARLYQELTGDVGIYGWVRHVPQAIADRAAVILPGGEILFVGEARWAPRGFVAVSGKEERWTRVGDAQTGTS